jgi:uncharacterized protein YqjF (DUF2071 family)
MTRGATPAAQSRERVRHPVMFQQWTAIAFLHWPYDADRLQRRLPEGLRVDTCEGSAWIGLTPFHLRGLRPRFLPPLPGLSSFPETNLRTYVIGPAGPGIWFFSLDAASALAVAGARLTYGLPYHRARMRVLRAPARVLYWSERPGAGASISIEVGPPLREPDERARFLTERYRLYSVRRGRLGVASVEHAPWPLRAAMVGSIAQSLTDAAGLTVESSPLAHFSWGVHVRVGRLRPAPRADQAVLTQ